MTFEKRIKNPGTMIRAGLVFLVIANVAQYLVRRSGVDSGPADGAMGLAFGLSFGLLLMGVWVRSRRRAGCGPN